MDSVLRKQNSLGYGFRKTSATFGFRKRRRRGLGRNPPLAPSVFWAKFGADKNTNTSYRKIVSVIYLAMYCPSLKGMHPRHPPRAFPLWLLAPRCLRAGKACASWGEEVSSPRVGRYTPRILGVRPRHPHSTLCI